jgi:hypothetical protein
MVLFMLLPASQNSHHRKKGRIEGIFDLYLSERDKLSNQFVRSLILFLFLPT